MMNCKMSILSMVANAAKLSNPMAGQSEKWTRPAPRQVKLNVDASFYAESQDGSVGAILRDYQGQFLAASSKVLPHVASATMAEALAMKEGLLLANRMGCNSVIAEGDSIETIEACT
jgi:ribonuclease HI